MAANLGMVSTTKDDDYWYRLPEDKNHLINGDPMCSELVFCRDVLGNSVPGFDPLKAEKGDHGSTMWQFSRHLVQAVMKHKRVAVTSSRSTSKTYTLGQLVPAFLYSRPSRVIIVAPSMRQVEKGVMSEAKAAIARATRKLHSSSTSAKEIKLDERHWALGLPSRDPDAMRGFHASPTIPSDPDADFMSAADLAWVAEQAEDESVRMLVVIDEAPGVSSEAFRVLRGMLTKPNVYLVMTGNPFLGADEDHDYVRAFHEGSSFHRMRVSSIPLIEAPAPVGIVYDEAWGHVPQYLVSKKEIDNARNEYEAGDPIFQSDWCGTFPSGSTEFNVVPRAALEAAVSSEDRNLRPLGPRIGVDIGTGKPDMCVASLFVDGVKRTDYVWAPDADDQEGQVSIATTIQALCEKWGAECAGVARGGSEWDGGVIEGPRVSIDDSGLVGVCDILASRGLYVDRVNFARGAAGQWRDLMGTQRFLNQRTEMHWAARRGLQEGVFVIPKTFTRSWNEATWTCFERTFDGKGPLIKLEPKEKVKKRNGGRSPDTFDADLLAMRETSQSPAFSQAGRPVLAGKISQPVRAGRLRPTRLKGGKRL